MQNIAVLEGGRRNCGIGFALLRQDNGQRWLCRNYGIMDLRRLRQTTRQLVNETTSRAAAACSLVVCEDL